MVEIRDRIFEQLKNIENEQFLNNILDLVQHVDEQGVYQLSATQKNEIDQSIAQIESGQYMTHDEVMKKYLK